jgi:alpha-tubulin suppressor-like RCC1 family protein
MAVAVAVAVVGALAGCDELPVEVELDSTLEISLERFLFNDSVMVGQLEYGLLRVVLNGNTLTGLRTRWHSLDSTALSVRALSNLTLADSLLDTLDSKSDTLLTTLLGEITALKRGRPQRFSVELDSAGFGDVLVDTVEIDVYERWGSVSAGASHTCAVTYVNPAVEGVGARIRPGGEVFCWGEGEYGALGTGSANQSPVPVPVLSGTRFLDVQVGGGSFGGFTCARDQVGLLHCWGDNLQGQLGLGNLLDQFVPRLTSLGKAFAAVDVGMGPVTCGISAGPAGARAATLCWGRNDMGQLGCDTFPSCLPDRMTEPNTAAGMAVFDRSVDGEGIPVVFQSISLGMDHGCGIKEVGGGALCWGKNENGQLGNGTQSDFSRFAVEVGRTFSAIAAGDGFTCGIDASRTGVLCWGVVPPSAAATLAPTPVVFPEEGMTFRGVSAGSSHVCAVTDSNRAFCWGANENGQLGDGSTEQRAGPVEVRIASPGDLPFESISVGQSHTCGVSPEDFDVAKPAGSLDGGSLYCWGSNQHGQLGVGEEGLDHSPVPVRVLISR